MNSRWPSCLSALLILLLTACRTPEPAVAETRKPIPVAPLVPTNQTSFTAVAAERQLQPEWLRSPTNFFTLGPGDRLEIEVIGDPTTRALTVVGPDGKLYYYLLPGMDVWGLTLAQARERIEREIVRFFQQQPRVSLTLRGVESKQVWLLGRVAKPGIYPLAAPMTLIEALSLAGGPASASPTSLQSGGAIATASSQAADLRRGFVLRQGQLLPVDFHRLMREGDASQNIYVQADDFVYLPSAVSSDVYVLGAVGQPRSVSFGDRMDLVSAVAGAGGTIKDAYLSHVAIVRGSMSAPKIAVVDYQAIVRGRAPNVPLEPHDIVFVPFTSYRTLSRYTDLILTTFVRTIGVNEGARAAGGNATLGITVAP